MQLETVNLQNLERLLNQSVSVDCSWRCPRFRGRGNDPARPLLSGASDAQDQGESGRKRDGLAGRALNLATYRSSCLLRRRNPTKSPLSGNAE